MHEIPNTNDEMVANISMTEIVNPSPHPSPLGGEG